MRVALQVALLAALSCGLCGCHRSGGDSGQMATATSDPGAARSKVFAQGRLIPAKGILNLGATPGDQIESLPVPVGTRVEANAPLATLKSHTLRELELELAQSRLAEAEVRLKAQKRLSDSQRALAQLSVEQAELKAAEIAAQAKRIQVLEQGVQVADREHRRLQSLRADPATAAVVSPQEVERQHLLAEQARSDLEGAKADLEVAQRAQRLARTSADVDSRMADDTAVATEAAVPITSLQIAVRMAQEQLDMTELKAPCAGQILALLSHEGDQVGSMPVLQFADLSQMVCVAEVYESNLSEIRAGMTAEIASPALPRALRGKVVEIGRLIGRPSLPSPNPLERVDRRTAEVRIELSPEDSALAAEVVNLQVEVTILSDTKLSDPSGAPARSGGAERGGSDTGVDGDKAGDGDQART